MKRNSIAARCITVLFSIFAVLILSGPLGAMGTNKDLEERVARLEALLEETTAR
jgi:hypothetical protein